MGHKWRGVTSELVFLVSFHVLGGCARTHTPQAREKKPKYQRLSQVSKMIVHNNCGTKNNNASLQSNN